MSGKPIDIQHNHKITTGAEVPAGYVGLFAKADGLYEKLPGEGGAERKLYNESTGGVGGGIGIPQLKIAFGHYRAAGDPVRRRDDLWCYWDQADESFLDYNPEVWVFRRRNNLRRKLVSETLSDELCGDPGCDDPGAWTFIGDVGISSSQIYFDNAAYGALAAHYLSTYVAHPYSWYELSFTVSEYEGGIIRASYGNGHSVDITGNGTYTFRLRRTDPNTPAIAFASYGTNPGGTTLKIDDVSFRRVIRSFNLSHKKKWSHEPHLNGVKYPGSAFWAGEINCDVEEISASGRHTEFELTAGRAEKQLIGLDPYEYIYARSKSTSEFFKLSDETEVSDIESLKAAGSGTLSIGFRLAVVIDHPTIEGAKIMGDLSDPIYLRAQTAMFGIDIVSLLLRYRPNQIIIR